MGKIDREKHNEELKNRSEYIISCVEKAQQDFDVYKKTPTLENYKNFKNSVKEFYEDGWTTYYRRNVAHDQSIRMLKSFKASFPKQYKIIVKRLLSEGIEYNNLVNFNDKELDSLQEKQQERVNKINKLHEDFKKNNKENFELDLFWDIYFDFSKKMKTLEKIEEQDIERKFIDVDFYSLYDESVNTVKNNIKKETKEKPNSNIQPDEKED